MKLKLTSALFIAALGLLLVSRSSSGADHPRQKRQAMRQRPYNNNNNNNNNSNNNYQVDDESPANGQAVSATAMSSSSGNQLLPMQNQMNPMNQIPNPNQTGVGNYNPPQADNRRPRPAMREEELEESAERRPARRGRPNWRPSYNKRRMESENEDEECDDADYDYRDMFVPMRQIGRIMNNVFSRMQSGMGYDDEEGPVRGGNLASASAFSLSDSDSRLSSFVSQNGRSRGVISETRNGRTKTRRYGSGDDEDEEEE